MSGSRHQPWYPGASSSERHAPFNLSIPNMLSLKSREKVILHIHKSTWSAVLTDFVDERLCLLVKTFQRGGGRSAK